MLTIEQSNTSSSGKGAHGRLCVCVSRHQVLSSSAPHPFISNCLHKAGPVPPPKGTLGHNSFSQSDKSASSVNFSNTLLLCSNYSSANTQHLAGRDWTPNRAFPGTAESCFGSWDGLRTAKAQFPLLVGIRVRLSKWYLQIALWETYKGVSTLFCLFSALRNSNNALGKRLENIYCHCHLSLHQKSSWKRGNAGANAYIMGVCWLGETGNDLYRLQNLKSCTDRINPHCWY